MQNCRYPVCDCPHDCQEHYEFIDCQDDSLTWQEHVLAAILTIAFIAWIGLFVLGLMQMAGGA